MISTEVCGKYARSTAGPLEPVPRPVLLGIWSRVKPLTTIYPLLVHPQKSVGGELWKSERCHIIQGENNGETQELVNQLLQAYLCQACSKRYQVKIQIPRKGNFEIYSFCKNARCYAMRVQ